MTDERYTQPTPHLRFVGREVHVTDEIVRKAKILQQWWVGPGTYSDHTDSLKWPGMWIDVPHVGDAP